MPFGDPELKLFTAEIIATGDELTLGRIANTNAAWLSRRLTDLGFVVTRHVVLPDVFDPICREYRAAFQRSDLVVLSGGLGPTVDDLTRDAVARAARVPLARRADLVAGIRAFFARRGRPMPPNNERQADLPAGAAVLRNSVGTAPGFALRALRSFAIALPGVPAELFPMFDRAAVPVLRRQFRGLPRVASRELEIVGIPESAVDARLAGLASPHDNPRLSLMVRHGHVCVRLVAHGADGRPALRAAERRVRREFGDAVFGEDGQDLGDVVAGILLKRRLTVAVAESYTGGLVAHLLTEVPGISASLLESLVTYSNESKSKRLGVSPLLIRAHGAVSPQVASAMARGLAKGADVALATTGIAGPSGGSKRKPVGLGFSAVAMKGRVTVCEHRVVGDRSAVKARAARLALDHLRRRLLGVPVGS